jgi:hypothetical protein
LLRAMLVEKLSINSMKHPLVIPPSQKNAWGYFGDRPHVRNATGIALQDWDGGCIQSCPFRKVEG